MAPAMSCSQSILKKMLDTNIGCDFEIITPTKSFRAHKFVVDDKHYCTPLEVDDVWMLDDSPDLVQDLLFHCYGMNIPRLADDVKPTMAQSFSVVDLWNFADDHGFMELAEECREWLFLVLDANSLESLIDMGVQLCNRGDGVEDRFTIFLDPVVSGITDVMQALLDNENELWEKLVACKELNRAVMQKLVDRSRESETLNQRDKKSDK